MKPFEYTNADNLQQVLVQLTMPGVVVKAGGVDLVDRMKEGLDSPSRVVNILGLRELDFLSDDAATGIRIGPLVTLARLGADEVIRRRLPALAEAAAHAATPQIRNVATAGGNLVQRPRCWYFRSADFQCRKKGGVTCFAQDGENQFHAIFGNSVCAIVHPSALATALVAYRAGIVITGAGGKRELSLEDFFTPPERDATRENSLQQGEVITEIRVPAPATTARSAYHKQVEKESFDWPIADVAVVLEMDGRTCRKASVVLGAAAPVPRRAVEAEQALGGRVVDEKLADAAAKAALAEASPLGKNGYKVSVFQAVIRRTILAAANGGGA